MMDTKKNTLVLSILSMLLSLVVITSCQEPSRESKDRVIPKDEPIPATPTTTPNACIIPKHEPMFDKQWYLSHDGGIDINILPVWQKCYGTKPISVGIIDGAIDVNHPDLKGRILEKGTGVYNAKKHHGTAVAGLLAAQDNGEGIIGVAPRAKVYSYSLSFPTSEADVTKVFTDIADDIETEYSDIAVYNASLGNTQIYNYPMPSEQRDAFDEITEKGFHGRGANLVSSAGNNNPTSNKTQTSSNDSILNHYSIIAVNALNKTGELSEIYLGSARGVNIWVTAPSDTDASDMISTFPEGAYGNFGRTSAAAPLVSGAIALLRSEYPHLTWRDVKLILAESAKKYDDAGKAKYKASGVKCSDKSEQQYSYRMGFGLLDVAKAFDLAEGWKLLPPMKERTHTGETFTMPKINTHTSDVSVGAPISFIESVTLEMNIEATDKTKGIKFHTLKLHSPDGKTSIIYEPYEPVGFSCIFRNAKKCFVPNGQETLVFVVNSFLGSSAQGDWKLEIQQFNDYTIEKVSSWKLTFRGH